MFYRDRKTMNFMKILQSKYRAKDFMKNYYKVCQIEYGMLIIIIIIIIIIMSIWSVGEE